MSTYEDPRPDAVAVAQARAETGSRRDTDHIIAAFVLFVAVLLVITIGRLLADIAGLLIQGGTP